MLPEMLSETSQKSNVLKDVCEVSDNNYLSKIIDTSYVKKNATEASCYNLFYHWKVFCPAVQLTSH